MTAQAIDPRAIVPGASITGIVLDAAGHNIPNATVRLFMDGQPFDINNNPQQSNAVVDPSIFIGRYQFNRLPYGTYTVIAEIKDAAGNVHEGNLSVNVSVNTVTADVVIPDLVTAGGPSPSAATLTPSAMATPSAASSSPGAAALIFLLLGLGVLMISKKSK